MKRQRPIVGSAKLNLLGDDGAQLWRELIDSEKSQCSLHQPVKIVANGSEALHGARQGVRPSDLYENATVTP